ncbi:hypothetical protein J8273_5240 [Carpediemonas membranifera]|uniref:Uncharacterized protein n=1 Tax=Carpediemonas membranifera TaxID=201153 RepID=A0A8J6ATU0_9EUKA|nr:hypothetical protein J8273_5240 [Carpediemonas membranifera]|eukprot:KAG9392255.1 hypothetical protein J8273_5240 [Carpediemonas membranifera]
MLAHTAASQAQSDCVRDLCAILGLTEEPMIIATSRLARLSSVLLLLNLSLLSLGAVIKPPADELVILDGASINGRFGRGLTLVNKTTAIVGQYLDTPIAGEEYAGNSYLYSLANGEWLFDQDLCPPDIAKDDRYGRIAASNGTTMAVVAHNDDNQDVHVGSVSIFDQSPSGMTFNTKLHSVPQLPSGEFGRAVDMQGTTMAITSAAYLRWGVDGQVAEGAVFIFEYDESTHSWVETQRLFPQIQNGTNFGDNVVIEGDFMTVGAHRSNEPVTDAGSLVFFHRDEAGWVKQYVIVPDGLPPGAYFGYHHDMSGSRLIVGAKNDLGIDGATVTGAAYIYERNASDVYELDAKLSGVYAGDSFGSSVAIEGNVAVVCAVNEMVNGACSVFIKSHKTWVKTQILTTTLPARTLLGVSLAMDSGTVLVGASDATSIGSFFYYDLTYGYCPPRMFNSEGSCNNCAVGHYQPGWNQSTCAPASVGYYSDDFIAQAACAVPGTYTNTTGMSACDVADPGWYVDDADRTHQVPCDAGYISTSAGQSSCTQSSAGFYVPDDGEPHTSGLACPTGHFCPSGSTSPTPCPIGTFNPNTNAGHLASCMPCPAGTYSSNTGLTSAGECTPCSPGKYCATPGLAAPTGSCSAGYYCTGGADTPTPTDGSTGDICPVGNYCPGGSTAPVACESGTYQDFEGQTTCTACEAGYYCPEGTSDYTIYTCPAGYYCPEGTITSTEYPCPAGTYSAATGRTLVSQCTSCSAGKYCETTGLTEPAGDCSEGYYCAGGATTPTPTDGISGNVCPAGFYCPAGSSTPTACPRGTYNPSTGAEACLSCAAGSYCGSPGLTSVTGLCSAGYYCTGGATTPTPTDGDTGDICPTCHYCPTASSAPTACPAGSYQDAVGQTNCMQCPAGHYCPIGSASPTSCAPGAYQDQGGKGECKLCSTGYYCLAATVVPDPCPAGTYSSNTGLTSAGECTVCPPGVYCATPGLAAPTGSCSAGYYCAGGADTPTPTDGDSGNLCPAGKYCPEGSGDPEPCTPGTYAAATGMPACDDADAGYYANEDDFTRQVECADGTYQPETGQTSCISASAGYHADANDRTAQYVCDGGNYSAEPGQADCSVTDAGYYTPADTLPHSVPVPCHNGTYQPAGGQSSCESATAGHYVLADGEGHTTQENCLAGTYQSETGHSSCNEAQPGFYAAGDGATEEEPCDSGHFSADSGSDSCEAATPGYYVDEMDKTAQRVCDNGQYQPESGQSSCSTATAGHYVPADNQPHTSELDCSQGHYQPSTGQSTCVAASVGHYVSGTAANAQVECESGKFQNETGQTSCYTAEAGYYVSNSDYSHQKPCDGGLYSTTSGLSACESCPTGSSTATDGKPHSSCTEFIKPTVTINTTTAIAVETADMTGAVDSALLGSTSCVVTTNGTNTVIIPFLDTSEPIAGTYTLTYTLDNGETGTTSVVIPPDFTIPETEVVVVGTKAKGVLKSPVCPQSAAFLGKSAAVSHASVESKVVKCVSDDTTIDAAILKNHLSPFVDSKLEQGGIACVSLNGAQFGSTDKVTIKYDGSVITALAVDESGRICFTVPASADSTVDEPHEVTAELDGTTFLAATVTVAVPVGADDGSSGFDWVKVTVIGLSAAALAAIGFLTIALLVVLLLVVIVSSGGLAIAQKVSSKFIRSSPEIKLNAFQLAAMDGNADTLLKLCTDTPASLLDARNADGRTSVFIATQCGHVGCVTLLADAGADVNIAASSQWVLKKGKKKIVKSRGLFNGDAPIHVAAAAGDIECLRALLAAKADVTLANDDGKTALSMAQESLHDECVEAIKASMPERKFAEATDVENVENGENSEFDGVDSLNVCADATDGDDVLEDVGLGVPVPLDEV